MSALAAAVELVVKCACPSLDGNDCARTRYDIDVDDETDPCECACHKHDRCEFEEPCDAYCDGPRCGGCGRRVKAEGHCAACTEAA